MDLRAQLQISLGSAIALERELGGGGMSRVFVARDVALGRRMVVKVLLPELAAGMSAERFRREILLAANLQHPHIVPLLAAGDAAGLPWYTMPFVEGESLRARLSRGGELPIGEAVQLLRQVTLALGYAHEHSVVHRDIKPENVLLSGGAAMVTDFGVAKALSEAGSADATSGGLALGTPAYMAPEQAAADPHVDHRADIYALGVMAYELLSGEPPFTARTPQALLAAHVVEAPPPLDRRRSGLPPALVGLVMRCLAKRAADRPQSAAEVLQALDGLSTPTGGSTPTVALPSLAGPRYRPRLAAWTGALGLVLLAAGGAWWAQRGRGTTPAAVGASGVADPPPSSVAVLPLVNVGHDTASEYFSDGMTDELTGALGGVPGLRVASRTSAYAFKGKEGVDVREIGRQLNVGTVLEGTVRRAGDRVRLTAQLSDTRSGLALWSQSYERQLKDVFAVQDDIARSIVGTLRLKFEGSPGAERRPTGPRQLEAHDLYLRGRHALDRVTEPDLRQSIAHFEQAIALDSTYALPWVGITAAWSNLADDWVPPHEAYPKALAAARRAVALAPDLAEGHAELAGQILQYEWNLDSTQRELDRALALNPNFADAWGWQAQTARARGQLDTAVAYGRRAVALDPLSLWNRAQLIRLLTDAGRTDEAISVARQVTGMDSSFAGGWIYLADALLAAGRPVEALAAVQRAGPYGERRRVLLARALAGAGRRNEARRILADMIAAARERYIRPDGIASVYAALGERDSAFVWLDRLLEQRGAGAPFVELSPAFAPLRSDPRFAQFVRRVHEGARR